MLNVSSNPHIKARFTTRGIMLIVFLSMLPTTIWGIYNATDMFGVKYGIHAALLVVYTIATCVVAEFVFCKITKKKNSVGDLSCIVTGLILALNLPPTLPYWMAMVGAVFAIIVVKMLFGGLGQNFMNPALGARCFLVLSFASSMTKFFPDDVKGVDATSSATPLTALKATNHSTNLLDMFLGRHAGTIGETSILCILIGALVLVVFRIIDLRIPLTYIVTFALFIMLFNNRFNVEFLLEHILGGGLVFGAFYMATDYTTSPITKGGRYVFGICLGLLTAILRTFGATAEGVSFAIIICNLLVPLIEKITVPKAFGIVKAKEGK